MNDEYDKYDGDRKIVEEQFQSAVHATCAVHVVFPFVFLLIKFFVEHANVKNAVLSVNDLIWVDCQGFCTS